MAWIKVEHCTPDKPEVLRIARNLGISRDDAFGKLFRFWCWLDGNCVDGSVDGVVSTDVDAVVGAPGFCSSLARVGWLVIDDDGERLTVPNFERHNGDTAKARGLKARRQAAYRAKKAQTVDVKPSTKGVDARPSTSPSTTPSPREDKKREEIKSNTPPSPPEGATSERGALESFETNPGNLNDFAGGLVIPCKAFRRYIATHAKKTHYKRAAKAWNKIIVEGHSPETIIDAYPTSPRVVNATEAQHLPNPEAYLLEYVFLDPPISRPDDETGDNYGFGFNTDSE